MGRSRRTRVARAAGLCAVLIGGLVFASGCVRVPIERAGEPGVPVSVDAEVEREGAERAEVRLSMGAGEVFVEPGTVGGNLMEAEFDFQPAEWEPEVDYEVRGERGVLEVRQPRVSGFPRFQSVSNRWRIALAEDLPLELTASLGAGTSELVLGGLDLRALKVSVGAGDVLVDLSGEWSEDLRASIEGGAGSFRVRVPASTGVRVVGDQGGLGTFELDGFRRSGDDWVNDAYGSSAATIELRVTRGVGEVVIEQVD